MANGYVWNDIRLGDEQGYEKNCSLERRVQHLLVSARCLDELDGNLNRFDSNVGVVDAVH